VLEKGGPLDTGRGAGRFVDVSEDFGDDGKGLLCGLEGDGNFKGGKLVS
jgi:hypothetical protein